MDIKEKWGASRRIHDASLRCLIEQKLNDCSRSYGQLECVEDKVEALSEIVARLIVALKLTDEQVFAIVDLTDWEIEK